MKSEKVEQLPHAWNIWCKDGDAEMDGTVSTLAGGGDLCGGNELLQHAAWVLDYPS